MNIRPTVLSGSWYPADPVELAKQVDDFLAEADPANLTRGRALLAVSPHAGYAYSGSTAGKLFGLLKDQRPETVILLAPNHRQAIDRIALSTADAFGTPLGQVDLNSSAGAQLAAHPLFSFNDRAHAQEHAVEILLPFLQRTWPEPNTPHMVPMLVPHMDHDQVQLASSALSDLVKSLTGHTLILVSSDFTHFGSAFGYQPFVTNIPQSLETLDSGAILRILAGDPERLLEYGAESGITMCGLPAAAVALGCGLPEGYEAGLLGYSRSGDRDNDYSHSVSYASILITSGQEQENGH